MAFFDEYLFWATQDGVLDDAHDPAIQYPDFIEHRHDRSLLSLLCKRHGIPGYRDPSEWGDEWLKSQPSFAGAQSTYADMKRSTYPRIVECCRSGNPFRHWARLRLRRFL